MNRNNRKGYLDRNRTAPFPWEYDYSPPHPRVRKDVLIATLLFVATFVVAAVVFCYLSSGR